MEELSEDVAREILSRAAVKDLVRWKSVCKRWLRIISSRSFISLHHRRSSFTAVHATSVYGVVSQGIFAQLVGTCDGLLCLRNHVKGLICIWNPSLHAHHCLSLHIPKPPHDGLERCYWFGRGGGDDDENDGYKLIIGTASHLHLIALYDGDGCRVSLERELEKSYNFHETIGTRFQNSVYWPAAVGEDDDTRVIVSFDLGKETIGELPPPPPPNMKPARLFLGQVHGCLSALMLMVDLSYQLWVMTQQQQILVGPSSRIFVLAFAFHANFINLLMTMTMATTTPTPTP